jgi:hypothetical protein
MKIPFTKYGMAIDPTGAHCTFDIGARYYLVEIVGFYHSETRGVTLLKTRHFNGEDGPEICANLVNVLERSYVEQLGPKHEMECDCGHPESWHEPSCKCGCTGMGEVS